MEFLILWMHLDNGINMMTVQAMPIQCVGMATAAHKGAGAVDGALCTRSAEVIDNLTAAGECSPLEVRDDYVNFICKKRYGATERATKSGCKPGFFLGFQNNNFICKKR